MHAQVINAEDMFISYGCAKPQVCKTDNITSAKTVAWSWYIVNCELRLHQRPLRGMPSPVLRGGLCSQGCVQGFLQSNLRVRGMSSEDGELSDTRDAIVYQTSRNGLLPNIPWLS